MSVLSKFPFAFQLLMFLEKNIEDKPLTLCSIIVILILRPECHWLWREKKGMKKIPSYSTDQSLVCIES